MTDPELSALGESIRRFRRSLKISQEKLAESSGFHRTYICDVERGARNVSFLSIIKLSEGLGASLTELSHDVESTLKRRPGEITTATEGYHAKNMLRDNWAFLSFRQTQSPHLTEQDASLTNESKLQALGESVRRIRRTLKISQEYLGKSSGLHRTYICDVERGARNVSFMSLFKLVRGLGATLSELTHDVESTLERRIGESRAETKENEAENMQGSSRALLSFRKTQSSHLTGRNTKLISKSEP